MPFKIVRSDITEIKADAIVNPTDRFFSGGGGTDAAVHMAAGMGLEEELKDKEELGVGNVLTTSAGDLNCKYIIHTVGPVYIDGVSGEDILLKSCYDKALSEALRLNCKSIAFPLIATGTFGFPKGQALKIANSSISEFLMQHSMRVYLVLYDDISYHLSQELRDDISIYISENYEPEEICDYSVSIEEPAFLKKGSLKGNLDNLDESFQEMLLRKIEESGKKAPEIYNRANITKEHFYKIRHNKSYSPKKKTACAFAVALKLSIDETEELLEKAGYALSRSSKFDVIIRYFIEKGNYDIFEINEVLYDFDQELLGL